MRDILRILPTRLNTEWKTISAKEFMKGIASTFCSVNDARPTLLRRVWAEQFQKSYMAVIAATARLTESRLDNVIGKIAARSAVINRSERVTGDAICNVGEKILKTRKQMERRELFSVIFNFIDEQVLVPDLKLRGINRNTLPKKSERIVKDPSETSKPGVVKLTGKTESVLKALEKVVKDMRHGL
jgi:hypothetical protein